MAKENVTPSAAPAANATTPASGNATAKRGRKERSGFDIPQDWTRKNVDVTYVKRTTKDPEPDNSLSYSVGVPQAPNWAAVVEFANANGLNAEEIALAAFNARNLTFSQAGNAAVKAAYAQLQKGEIDQAAFDKVVSKAQRRVARSVFTGKTRSDISQKTLANAGAKLLEMQKQGAVKIGDVELSPETLAALAAQLGLTAPAAQ